MSYFESSDNIIINVDLAVCIGIDASVLFSELCSMYDYYKKHEMVCNGGYFTVSNDEIYLNTSFRGKRIITAINRLITERLIITDMKGTPIKRHFKIIATDELIESLIVTGKLKRGINE